MTATAGATADHEASVGLDIARRVVRVTGAQAAFLAGSTVVGLGNATSDIDVYLVGATLPDDRRQLFVGGVRVDVQNLPVPVLTSAVDKVMRVRLRSNRAGGAVPNADVALVVRLSTGYIVVDDGTLAGLRHQLSAEPLRLRRLVINSWLLGAYFAAEDLVGLVGSGDPLDLDAAVLTARTTLLAAGKALAAACGDLYFGEKWTWRQLTRSAPAGFPVAEFQRLLRADPLAGQPVSGLGTMVSLAQTCMIAAATLGWQDVPLSRWPRWREGPGPVRRCGEFLPRAYDDAVTVLNPRGRHLRMPPDVALVWGLSAGLTREEITEQAEGLSGTADAYERLTAPRCHDILDRLAAAGLVTEEAGR